MIGILGIVVGLVLAVMGLRLALGRRRPVNLMGMLLAPLGLLVALLGTGRLLSPEFFQRQAAARARSAAAGSPVTRVRIMPAGDSITRGLASDGGYRAPLWGLLSQAGAPVDFVGAVRSGPGSIDRDHESWSGLSIEGLGRRLAVDVAAHRPDVVLLQIGTSDVVAGAAPAVIERRLGALLDAVAARAPQARILVGSLLPVRAGNHFQLEPGAVAAANQALRAAVAARAARGARCQFVDLAAGTRGGREEPADFHADGLHPSRRGDERIAAAWFQALEPHLGRGR